MVRLHKQFFDFCKFLFRICFLLPSVVATLFSIRTRHTLVLLRSLVSLNYKALTRIRAESLLNSRLPWENSFFKSLYKKIAKNKTFTLATKAEETYRKRGHFAATEDFIKLAQVEIKESSKILGEDTLLFGPGWVSAFGHISNLSLFPKIEKLGWRRSSKLLIAGGRPSNPAMLDLYRNWYHVLSLDSHTQIFFDLCFQDIYQNMNAIEVRSCLVTDLYTAQFEVEEEIRKRFGETFHLLEVPDTVNEFGKQYLDAQGLDPQSWFVTLHMRETNDIGKYKGGDDVDPATYVAAINTILDLGGQVIRIGDNSMTPLDSLGVRSERVLDYAHVRAKHPQLDVYFLSACRYMIGTGSGPITFPNEFGRPVLYTNVPAIGRTFRLRGLSIPQLLKNKKTGKLLSLEDMLKSPLAWNVSPSTLELDRVANSTSEIVSGVIELQAMTESSQSNFWKDSNVHCIDSKLFSNWKIGVPVSDSFLQKYPEVFCA
jgi:putative glycosyltransferase (TIGR04372 family)